MTNICLIVVDALRARNLPEWGYHKMTTPRLQRFFDESIVYRNAFAQHNYTTPSIATMLTGEYYFKHGIWKLRLPHGTSYDKLHCPTIAEILKAEGSHRTIMINEVFPTLFDKDGIIWKKGFDVVPTNYSGSAGKFIHEDSGVPVHPDAAQTTDEALKYIDDDFFMYVHYWDVHRPRTVPFDRAYEFYDFPHYEDWSKYLRGLKKEKYRQHAWMNGMGSMFPEGNRDINFMKAWYDADIKYTDIHVSRLIKGLPDDTLIIFTADHGESWGEHGNYFAHGEADLFNEGIHVPLAIRLPYIQNEFRGRTFHNNVENRKVFDVMMNWVDHKTMLQIKQDYVYSCGRMREDGGIVDALIMGKYKLLMRNFGQEEYGYNLAADPMERHPLTTLWNPKFEKLRKTLQYLTSQTPP